MSETIGDTAEFLRDSRIYRIVGRTSVDVIKSGGYKISALHVERELLAHKCVDDVAVMGIKDAVWGQLVFALVVVKADFKETPVTGLIDELKKWCTSRMPKYSVPKQIEIIDKMPRNQLGKVNKRALIDHYEKI